jgi:hypothetical protein
MSTRVGTRPTATVRELIAALADTEDVLRESRPLGVPDPAHLVRRRMTVELQGQILTALHRRQHP